MTASVASVYVSKRCAPEEDIVPGKRYEHCMLDVVIKGVAARDAVKSKLGGEGDHFGQSRMGRPASASHFGGEKIS